MKKGWFHLGGIGLLFVLLMGCGSGGSSSGSSTSQPPTSPPTKPPPPPAGFTVSLSPNSITLDRGGAAESVQISVNPQNGFSGAVSVTLGDSPAGVTISPVSLSVSPGSPGNLTLSASSMAPFEEEPVSIDAESGVLTASASLQIAVSGAGIPDPYFPLGGSLVHGFYDPVRKLLFATNFDRNELDVISGVDLSVKARVPVPQPMGIDQMADGKTLVIGTEAQEIVTVDEDTLVATPHPYMDPNASPRLFFPTVCAMANGKVFAIGLEQGIESSSIYEGGQYLYEWDSTTNTFTRIQPTPGTRSFYEVDSLARSADHKWAVLAADQFYLYSSASDSFTSASLYTVDPPNNIYGVRGYAMNADGSEIAVASAQQVTFLNRSLQAIGSTPIPSAFQLARSSVQFSTDGSKLYLQYPFPMAIEEIDASSFKALGYVSGTVIPDGNNMERLLTTDAGGRAFIGIDGGLRLVSLRQSLTPNPSNGGPLTGPVCPQLNAILPLNSSAEFPISQPMPGVSIFVGGQPAPFVDAGQKIKIPASSTTGPVDMECTDQYGNVAVVPDGVSYGVDPIAFSATLLPPFGNPPSYLFGYGFNSVQGSLYSLRLDGRPTQQMVAEQDVGLGTIQAEGFLVPDGSPGESATIAVSSLQGTGTMPAATTYYAKPTILSADGLLQLTFDTHRNVLYALKAHEVDVLNAATLEWESPLKFPAGDNGSYFSMALSPDGSKLVVGGLAGSAPQFVVLDPDGFSPPIVATDSNYYNYAPGAPEFGSMVVTDSNEVWMAGIPDVVLDLSTMSFSTLPKTGAASQLYGEVLRASADGSHIYSAELNVTSGDVFSIDPSTHAIQKNPSFGYMFWTDLAVSPDGSEVAAVYAPPDAAGDIVGFFNSNLQYVNANVYPDASPPDDSGVLGATFSPGGKVLIVPQGDSFELWDAATGTLRARVMVPERLHVLVYPENAVDPQIALDSTGQTIYAISASGLTVVTLPEPMDRMSPTLWPSHPITGNLLQALQGSLATRAAVMRRAAAENEPGTDRRTTLSARP